MFLYCERTFFDYKTQSYEVVFDFTLKSDIEELMKFANIEKIVGEGSTIKTLLILNDMTFEKYKGPRAGFWYDVPLDFFKNIIILSEAQEFSLIKFTATMRNDKRLDFQKFRTKKTTDLFIDNTNASLNFKDSKFYSYINTQGDIQELQLIVRNVGCGNWNEVKGKGFHVVYDLGGDIKFSDAEMNCILARINIQKQFYGIISHWDLDHYRGLLDMDKSQLQLMKNIIVPTKMPKTLQLGNALNRLRRLGISIEIIKPSLRSGSRIKLVSQGKIKNLEIFRSSDGANINQSGIVLTVEGDSKIGVLTGDHYYPQIYNGVLNIGSLKPYEFVVPHHGGSAGNFDLTLWGSIPFISGALSTRSGRYRNLPQKKVHDFFVRQNSFHCTECLASDYFVSL